MDKKTFTFRETVLSYPNKIKLYPFLVFGIAVALLAVTALLTVGFTAFHVVTAILILCLTALCLIFIYQNVIRVDVRVRDSSLSDYNDSDSLYTVVDDLLNNVEVLYESRYQQQLLQNQAQIKALQNQINPHFLYNTLDSIRGQALENNSREIADMLGALSAFFRYTISSKQDIVTVEQELHNVENYMKIQQYRFANRFSLIIEDQDISDAVLSYKLPKLTLQPIVENAINHGLSNLQSGGTVTITLATTRDLLKISVADNGCGMSEGKLVSLNASLNELNTDSDVSDSMPYSGIALRNVNGRIRLMFGDRYGIHIYAAEGIGTTVEIILPFGEKPI